MNNNNNNNNSNNTDGSWKEWSQYVRMSISELKDAFTQIQKDMNKIQLELGILKVKIAMWGGVGASVATVVVQFLFKYFTGAGG